MVVDLRHTLFDREHLFTVIPPDSIRSTDNLRRSSGISFKVTHVASDL